MKLLPLVRFRLFVAFVSLLGAAGLWALNALVLGALLPAGGQGDYAVLICDAAVPDRELRERLESQGFSGLVSESGQWVLLDTFGGIEQIALDEYSARVLPFDPRNDGYAEKLRSLFVRDDKRLVYIPLGSMLPASIKKKLAVSLDDIPHSLAYASSGLPVFWAVLLFCLAYGALAAVRPLREILQPYAGRLLPCLPALVPLALGGAAGFALISLLAGFAALLTGPCYEQLILPRLRRMRPNHKFNEHELPRIKTGFPEEFRIYSRNSLTLFLKFTMLWLLPSLLLICCGIILLFTGLPLVFALLVMVFFCSLAAFSLWGAYWDTAANSGFANSGFANSGAIVSGGFWVRLFFSQPRAGHRRFSPVAILVRRPSGFDFSWVMLPFAAAALVLLIVALAVPKTAPADFSVLPSAAAITEEDFYAHYTFQSRFSQRSLQGNEANVPPVSPPAGNYELADDGLLVPAANSGFSALLQVEPLKAELPPFTLSNVLRYLDTVEHGTAQGLLTVLLPLLFILPIFIKSLRVVDLLGGLRVCWPQEKKNEKKVLLSGFGRHCGNFRWNVDRLPKEHPHRENSGAG